MSVSPTTTIHAAMNNELNTTVSSHFRIDGPNTQDADTALLAAGDVLFYAHRAKLLLGSSNSFGGLVTSDHSFLEITMTNYRSEVLNVVLLAVYELPINDCDPSLKTLCEVIPALTKLGYDLRSIAGPQSELFQLFLKAAEGDPLSLYAVAAQHSFEELAVSASTFSLNTPIMQLSNELAQQMGAIYLQRLLPQFSTSNAPVASGVSSLHLQLSTHPRMTTPSAMKISNNQLTEDGS